jgi:hypothetical protein
MVAELVKRGFLVFKKNSFQEKLPVEFPDPRRTPFRPIGYKEN